MQICDTVTCHMIGASKQTVGLKPYMCTLPVESHLPRQYCFLKINMNPVPKTEINNELLLHKLMISNWLNIAGVAGFVYGTFGSRERLGFKSYFGLTQNSLHIHGNKQKV